MRAGLRIPHSLVLIMARFRLSSHNLGVVSELARGCKRCAALGMRDLLVDDETHLLFSCPATAMVKQERRVAELPFTSLQDLMCCRQDCTPRCTDAPLRHCSILKWLTSLAIVPLWHSQAEAEASGRAVACECSSPTPPVGPWGMVVVVVEALGYGCSSPTLPLGPCAMAVVVVAALSDVELSSQAHGVARWCTISVTHPFRLD
jgi:hypothetical protein